MLSLQGRRKKVYSSVEDKEKEYARIWKHFQPQIIELLRWRFERYISPYTPEDRIIAYMIDLESKQSPDWKELMKERREECEDWSKLERLLLEYAVKMEQQEIEVGETERSAKKRLELYEQMKRGEIVFELPPLPDWQLPMWYWVALPSYSKYREKYGGAIFPSMDVFEKWEKKEDDFVLLKASIDKIVPELRESYDENVKWFQIYIGAEIRAYGRHKFDSFGKMLEYEREVLIKLIPMLTKSKLNKLADRLVKREEEIEKVLKTPIDKLFLGARYSPG